MKGLKENITLFVCKNLLVRANNIKAYFFLVVLILIGVYDVLDLGLDAFGVGLALFGVAVGFGFIIFINKRNKKLITNQFYIAEDIFLSVDKRTLWSRGTGVSRKYTLQFTRNGVHKIVLRGNRVPEKPSCDYSAANYSERGDKFYLLIVKGKKYDKILHCFNAKFYQIFEPDFDYQDGIYVPKV